MVKFANKLSPQDEKRVAEFNKVISQYHGEALGLLKEAQRNYQEKKDIKSLARMESLTPPVDSLLKLKLMSAPTEKGLGLMAENLKKPVMDRNGNLTKEGRQAYESVYVFSENLYLRALSTVWKERAAVFSKLGSAEGQKEIRLFLTAAALDNDFRLKNLEDIYDRAVVTDGSGKILNRFFDKSNKDDVEKIGEAKQLRAQAGVAIALALLELNALQKGGSSDAAVRGKLMKAIGSSNDAEKKFDKLYQIKVEKYEEELKEKQREGMPTFKRAFYWLVDNDYVLDIAAVAALGFGSLAKRVGYKMLEQMAMRGTAAFFATRGAETVTADVLINGKITSESLLGFALMFSSLGPGVTSLLKPGLVRGSVAVTSKVSGLALVASLGVSETQLVSEALRYGLTPIELKAFITNTAFILAPLTLPKGRVTEEDVRIAKETFKENYAQMVELYKNKGGVFGTFREFLQYLKAAEERGVRVSGYDAQKDVVHLVKGEETAFAGFHSLEQIGEIYSRRKTLDAYLSKPPEERTSFMVDSFLRPSFAPTQSQKIILDAFSRINPYNLDYNVWFNDVAKRYVQAGGTVEEAKSIMDQLDLCVKRAAESSARYTLSSGIPILADMRHDFLNKISVITGTFIHFRSRIVVRSFLDQLQKTKPGKDAGVVVMLDTSYINSITTKGGDLAESLQLLDKAARSKFGENYQIVITEGVQLELKEQLNSQVRDEKRRFKFTSQNLDQLNRVLFVKEGKSIVDYEKGYASDDATQQGLREVMSEKSSEGNLRVGKGETSIFKYMADLGPNFNYVVYTLDSDVSTLFKGTRVNVER